MVCRRERVPEIEDGDMAEVKGSAAKPYQLKNVGGVYSCSCPAWRNQSTPIERRTCKHLRKYRGEAAEKERLGGQLPVRAKKSSTKKDEPPILLAHAWTIHRISKTGGSVRNWTVFGRTGMENDFFLPGKRIHGARLVCQGPALNAAGR